MASQTGTHDELKPEPEETVAPKPSLIRRWWQVLTITVFDWQEDKATQLAAALAYFTLFSIAPLAIVMIAIAGALFGDQSVSGHLYQDLRAYMGAEAASFIQGMVAKASQPGAGKVASIISLCFLLYGASHVFSQLKEALNTVWEVETPADAGFFHTIRYYLLSFAMVLSVGFVLLVSLILHTFLATAQKWLEGAIPGSFFVAYLSETGASLIVTALLFALILKYLPDCHVAWKHVWLGAFVTAVLFTVGKFLFALYLSRGTIGSSYGAAGSVIVILLWAYYSALIFLFGAEFTQAHARVFGNHHRTCKK
jgi:membrane protein